jgi:TRAP-type C4-dicarboxylate transport system substrate-binding protein
MKRSLVIIGIMGVTLFVLSHLYYPAHAAEPVIKLKLASFIGPAHGVYKVQENYCKEIGKRTNGRVEIAFYGAETLVKAAWTYDAVVRGVADIGVICPAYTRGQFPLLTMLDMPLGQSSAPQISRLDNAFIKKFKPKELDDVHFFYAVSLSPSILHTKKPVYNLKDAKGLKIRGTGISERVIRSLGATPVALAVPEVYDALQRGVVDGAWSPLGQLIDFRLMEVTDYTLLNYAASDSILVFYAINKKKWEALPADIQDIFTQVNEEYAEIEAKVLADRDKEATDLATKRGHKFITISKEEAARWAEKVKPIADEYVKELESKGLPGSEGLKFCKDYIQKHPGR